MEIIDRDVNKFDGGIIERNNKLRLYCIIFFSLPATNTCLRSALMTVNEKLEAENQDFTAFPNLSITTSWSHNLANHRESRDI